MLYTSHGVDLRGDRGGKKEKKKPKADKPSKGVQRESIIAPPPAASRAPAPAKPGRESGGGEER